MRGFSKTGFCVLALALTASGLPAFAEDGTTAFSTRRAPVYNAPGASAPPMAPVPNPSVASSGDAEEGNIGTDWKYKEDKSPKSDGSATGMFSGIKTGFSSMGSKVSGAFSNDEAPMQQRRAPAANVGMDNMAGAPGGMPPMMPPPPAEFGEMPAGGMPPVSAGAPIAPLSGMESIPPLPPQGATAGDFPNLGNVPPPPPPGAGAMANRDAMMAERDAKILAKMEADAAMSPLPPPPPPPPGFAPSAGAAPGGWESYPRTPAPLVDVPPPPQEASVPADLYTLPSQQVHLKPPSVGIPSMRVLPDSRYSARRAQERARYGSH